MARRKQGKGSDPAGAKPAPIAAPASEAPVAPAEGGSIDVDEPTQADAVLPPTQADAVLPPTQADAVLPPTQADAVLPPGDGSQPMEDGDAGVQSPMAGDTEKLYTDRPPVPPDDDQDQEFGQDQGPDQDRDQGPDQDRDQGLATVTDISSAVEPAPASDAVPAIDPGRLEGIVESLLFASDKPLGLADLKRLLGERDGKKITAAVDALAARRAGSGVHVTSAAGGWQLRTNPEHASWVGKLLAGRPVRLSRAMLETIAIVAYRQPVTRPEIDDIRGVDCGPVLKTLLDRGLVRIIGKKEEVGRPMLYGTTPEFLRTFNLRDLAELPTLREFHELGADEKAKVDAEHGAPAGAPEASGDIGDLAAAAESVFTPHPPLAPDPEEDDTLIDDLERASQAAAQASGAAAPPPDTAPSSEPPNR